MGAEILVVDDDPAVCELVAIILGGAGYRPTVSLHPQTALGLFAERHHFDLAILDVVMPRMGGEGLAARLRRDDPDSESCS